MPSSIPCSTTVLSCSISSAMLSAVVIASPLTFFLTVRMIPREPFARMTIESSEKVSVTLAMSFTSRCLPSALDRTTTSSISCRLSNSPTVLRIISLVPSSMLPPGKFTFCLATEATISSSDNSFLMSSSGFTSIHTSGSRHPCLKTEPMPGIDSMRDFRLLA